MQYRPDIDGMRAIAVLGVLFYHAGLGFPGGYIGVDVFFVISGFLITTIILNELRNGKFSLIHFWGKRIRRILPAVSLVVLSIIIAGWFLMPPGDYRRLGEQVLTLILLSANFKFWKENDYFDKAADTNPMLHTWSLSIEEQFYLLLPVILFLLFKYNREKWIYPLLWITIIVSFVTSVYMSYTHPKSNFFLLHTRIWELDVGVLIAYHMPKLSRRSADIFSVIGLLGILIPYFIYPEGIKFPGMSALPPVLGAAMLIIAGSQTRIGSELTPSSSYRPLVSNILSLKPLVFIGLISYSLYLWHWPILALQKYLSLDHTQPWIQLLLLASAFVIAWISWRFIEQPFRDRRNFPKEVHIYLVGFVLTLLLALPAASIIASRGAQDRLDPSIRNMYADPGGFRLPRIFKERKDYSSPIKLGRKSPNPANHKQNPRVESTPPPSTETSITNIPQGTTPPLQSTPTTPQDASLPQKSGTRASKSQENIPQIFVWGDSHASAILPAMNQACLDLGISCQASVRAATAPVLDWYYKDKGSIEFNSSVFSKITALAEENPSLIVMLAARWESYFARHKDGSYTAPAGFEEALSTTIQKLRENGIRVLIFKQVASFPFSPPDAYMRALFLGLDTSRIKTSIDENDAKMKDANSFFDDLKSTDVILFDPNRILADEKGDIFPAQKVDGLWYSIWRDGNHLSRYGSMKLVGEFKSLLDSIAIDQ